MNIEELEPVNESTVGPILWALTVTGLMIGVLFV